MGLLRETLEALRDVAPAVGAATARGNLRSLASLLGPAYRGLVERRARHEPRTRMPLSYPAEFCWTYEREHPEMARLYEAAKTAQWNARTDVDWSPSVDRDDPACPLIPDAWMPTATLPIWRKLSVREQMDHKHSVLSWLLSQFLHGEQGALFAAAQVTEAVPWLDGKLFGSTQVVDEGRHVEVFHTYLTQKLEKLYVIDDNLYVVIDSLMTDARWDLKFLGMQIMVEGLALGAFGAIRQATGEPLLREILRSVITDEARHVHYGVLALSRHYAQALSDRERREREEWALEITVLLRNRFFAREVYHEHYAHAMSRSEWDRLVLASELMTSFRKSMFRRIIPNLKRIGLLSERIKPHYAKLGLLEFEHHAPATELSAAELLAL